MNKIVLIGMLALGTDSLLGSLIYDTPATLTGTRSVGNGLTNGGGNGYDDLLLTWSIAEKANGTFDYSYVVSGFVSTATASATIQLGDWCYGASINPGSLARAKAMWACRKTSWELSSRICPAVQR